MKSLIYSLITQLVSLKHKFDLPQKTGDYFVRNKPGYISQFIGIYPQSITLESKLNNKKHITQFGAKDAEEFSFWAWRNCGIACVKMVLDVSEKAKNKSIMDLTNEGIELGGYILYENKKFVDKGWFHHALVALLKKHKVFARTKKWQTIESVAHDIISNKLVILSVLVPGRRHIEEDGSFSLKPGGKTGGHLLLATGVRMLGKQVLGIFAHDPRGLEKYQQDTFIPAHVFKRIFTNRTIVAENDVT